MTERIYVNGKPYLKGFFGSSYIVSEEDWNDDFLEKCEKNLLTDLDDFPETIVHSRQIVKRQPNSFSGLNISGTIGIKFEASMRAWRFYKFNRANTKKYAVYRKGRIIWKDAVTHQKLYQYRTQDALTTKSQAL